jgi:type IV pilus assembly protein PilY1
MNHFSAWLNSGWLILASGFFCGAAQADDTDIFFGNAVQSNVLFILDNSASMAEQVKDAQGNGTGITRIDAVKQAFPVIINGLDKNVRIGLMRLNSESSVAYPVSTLDPASTTELKNLVKDLSVVWGTAITNSLWEAHQYYAGGAVDHGRSRFRNGSWNSKYRVSHPDSYDTGADHKLPAGCKVSDLGAEACASEEIKGNPKYITPITSNCQTNHIVLLTDGAAVTNFSQDRIDGLVGGNNCQSDVPKDGRKDEACARTLVKWMAENVVNPKFSNSTIRLHTIAFNLSQPHAVTFLQDLAVRGKGTFHTADSASQLQAVFENLFFDVIDTSNTFAPASAGVNQFNRLKHQNKLYFSVFKPSASPRWSGNLKGYQLAGDPLTIKDKNNREAIDASTGFFKTTSTSFWSESADGNEAALGGAASKLKNPDRRKLWTNIVSPALNNAKNRIAPDNTEMTDALLNAADSAEKIKLLNWIRGIDVNDENGNGSTTEARLHMGAPIHSAPAMVTYGGTKEEPDISIFLGTSEGFLHAIEAKSGEEQFAFMPKSLLKNIKPQMINSSSQRYASGMDGSPVIWRQDKDQDNEIESGENDFVRLYMGMRRGGRDYYALDVTNRNNPRVLWQIEGGAGDGVFAALGQTWSTPVKARVKIGTVIKDVLLFAGGFDETVDGKPNQAVEVSMGNAIYMVDAQTGARLWMASKVVDSGAGLALTEMKYAIPSPLQVVDINHDGLADQFYVGDLGGQIWRFDVRHGMTKPADLVKGGLIASLGSNDHSIANNPNQRRFFAAPDLSTAVQDGTGLLVLAIGSGSMIDPKSTSTQDRFYVLKFPLGDMPDYATLTPITEANLTDRTDTINNLPVSASGWYIKMQDIGEKVLASSLTVDHQLIFTSYTPANTSATNCQAATGYGRYYLVDVANGNPKTDMNADGDLDQQDRFRRLKSSSIPSRPGLLFPEDSNTAKMPIGTELPPINSNVSTDLKSVYCYQRTST